MNRQRITLLIACIAVFLLVSTLLVVRAVQFQKTHYRVGSVPEEIVNQLIPKDVPLSALRPPALRPTDPVRYGNAASLVSIIEYGDYECDYCRQMAPVIRDVASLYDGKVRFIWRDFPLEDTHDNALPAAIFARCAGLQGKYWETYDRLMASNKLEERVYRDIATQLGLDARTLAACRADQGLEQMVRRDLEEARADGIKAVPLIFVGTQAFEGPITAETLRQHIDRVMKGV